jgi:tetratricopeptide (TPR) repeat protein
MLQTTKSLTALAAGLWFLAACSGTPESREAKHMAKGKTALAKKNYKAAEIEFKVASQNMPKDAEPVYQLGMAYLHSGSSKSAVEAFEKAVRLNPKHEGAQYQMALVKVGSNKPEVVQEGKKVLSAYLAGHAGDAETMAPLALAEAKLGNKAEALKLLVAAEEKTPANMRPAAIIIGFYAAKGDVETAKQVARGLAEHLPNSPDAATLRAQVSFSMRDFADADTQISRALALKPDFRPALRLRLRRELMNQNRGAAEQTTQQLSRLPERESWAAYAQFLFAENKIEQGVAEFKRVLQKHGDNLVLRDQFSRLLIGARRFSEAEAVVAGTLQKDPKDKAALLERTTLEIDKGDLDAATKDAKALHELKAFSAQLSFQEARIYAARGQTIQQGDLLAEALRQNPRLFQARLDLANLLTESGRPQNAVALLDLASPAEKQAPGFVYYRNMALIADGKLEDARKSVNAELAAWRSPAFLYQDAVLRLKAHDLTGARKALESAFQLAPADPPTLKLLGAIMNEQKEGPAFLAMVRAAATKQPRSAALQNTLGLQLLRQGDRNGARAAFEAAKAAGDLNADNEIAQLDLRAGAQDQARQRLLNLVKTHDNARARLLLAEIETRRGSSPDIVVTHYLKALDLEPTNVVVMNNLANVLSSSLGRYDDAAFWAQKALALAPASPVVEDTLGWIYYKQGKYDAALPYLEKSLIALDRPVAHYHLAGALLKAGDSTRAKTEYELALKQDPKSEARDAVDPLFARK